MVKDIDTQMTSARVACSSSVREVFNAMKIELKTAPSMLQPCGCGHGGDHRER